MKSITLIKSHRLYIAILMVLNGACVQLPQPIEPADIENNTSKTQLNNNYQIPSAQHSNNIEHPFGETTFSSNQQQKNYTDTLHLILLAELSKNNDDYSTAAKYFYQAAQQSKKAKLADQAVNMAIYAGEKQLSLDSAHLYQKLSHHSDKSQQLLVIALFVNQQFSEALTELEVLMAQLSNISEKNIDLLIKLLLQHPDKEVALNSVKRMIKQHPQQQDLNYVHVRLLLNLKRYEASLPVLDKLLTDKYNKEQVVLLYLDILKKLERYDQALIFMKKQLKNNEDDIPLQVQYIRLLVIQKQYSNANKYIKKILKKLGENSHISYASALLFFQNEQYELAKYYFKRLLKFAKLNSERESARYFLGQVSEKQDDFEQALSYYQKINPGEQQYFNARLRQALLLRKHQQTEAAISVLTKTHPHTPEEDELLIKLEAEIYIEDKNYDKALLAYHHGLKSQPDNLELLYMQGMIAEQADQLDLAEQSFRTVIKKDPAHIDAINALGYTLADRTDRYQEAYELIQTAYKLKPDAFYILDSLGWVLYRMGKYEESIKYLRQALDSKYDPEIAAHLGEVLWVSGDETAAKTLWTQVQTNFPDDSRLQETIKRFVK